MNQMTPRNLTNADGFSIVKKAKKKKGWVRKFSCVRQMF